MLTVAAYLFQYGIFIASAAMLVWAVLMAGKHPVSKHRWFRLAPLAFSAIMLGWTTYRPIVITSPKTGVVVHPGDSIAVMIQLRPAFLSALFPAVGVDLPMCWSCVEPPAGVTAHGALTGSPYQFTIDLPKTLPSGVLVTSATAAMAGSRRPALRSAFVEMIVKPE